SASITSAPFPSRPPFASYENLGRSSSRGVEVVQPPGTLPSLLEESPGWQKQDDESLMSASTQAFSKRARTLLASSAFPFSSRHRARRKSDQPFSGWRLRSSR